MTPFDESSPAFSPDGRWLAYVSDESGRGEVYVQPFPGPGGKWPISTDGGTEPAWSADGRELYFRQGEPSPSRCHRVGTDFRRGRAAAVFSSRYETIDGARNYDVVADGCPLSRSGAKARRADQLNVVLNWFAEVRARR